MACRARAAAQLQRLQLDGSQRRLPHRLPDHLLRDAVASQYATIAHRLGWLDLDRALPPAEFQRLCAGITADDRTQDEILAAWGEPSIRIGGRGSGTLGYATGDPADDPVWFHLDGDDPARLLVVRYRPGDFGRYADYTPTGLRRRPIREERDTVWLFHGDGARFASGVFANAEDGRDWARRHRVSGTLAEYAMGGAYDVAVAEGRFTRTRDHHGTPGHVAGFSAGLDHLHIVDGAID